MDCPRICASFRLFILELVQFAQDVDWDPNMVVRKSIHRMWVVQQDVCINHVIFDARLAAIGWLRHARVTDVLSRIVKKPGLIFWDIHLFLTATATTGATAGVK